MKYIKKYGKVRKFFSSMIKRYDKFLRLFNTVYKIMNGKRFRKEIFYRKGLSIFDCEELIKPLPYCPIEKIKDSNYYGYVFSLKKFIGDDKALITIEHGLYLDDQVSFYANYKTFDSICTMSSYRIDILKKHSVMKRLLAIGPYIHYAESLLSSSEIDELKNELGKVLLYMPSHSTNLEDGTSDFFEKELDIIDKFKEDHDYDSIMVCVYYRDFQYTKCINQYKKRGYKIVTAGHQLDLFFASRLKSIILLSDYTISNQIGTNLGFCVYLGKPHVIINDYEGKYNRNKSGYTARREIADAFVAYSPHLTKQQIEICNKYWGFDSIKSVDELLKFFANC